MKKLITIAAAAAAFAATPASAANVIAGNVIGGTIAFGAGTLRPGSPWGPGSTPSNAFAPFDGAFAPEGQQWNNGSYWIDSVVTGYTFYHLILNAAFSVDRFVVQADNNDTYQVQYWDGSAFQNVYTAGPSGGAGLRTRDSGLLGSAVTSDQFRIAFQGGDGYYSVSEFQAFQAVPEPATWLTLILGFGLVGGALRSRRSRTTVRYA